MPLRRNTYSRRSMPIEQRRIQLLPRYAQRLRPLLSRPVAVLHLLVMATILPLVQNLQSPVPHRVSKGQGIPHEVRLSRWYRLSSRFIFANSRRGKYPHHVARTQR